MRKTVLMRGMMTTTLSSARVRPSPSGCREKAGAGNRRMRIPHAIARAAVRAKAASVPAVSPSALSWSRERTAPATVAPARMGVTTSPAGRTCAGRGSRNIAASMMTRPLRTHSTATHRQETSPTTKPVSTGKHIQMKGDTMPKVPKAAARALGSLKRSESIPKTTI